jgi:hypothetical protein
MGSGSGIVRTPQLKREGPCGTLSLRAPNASGSGGDRGACYRRRVATTLRTAIKLASSATPSTARKNASSNLSTASQGSSYCASCERDANGRIRRSPAARRVFQASHPCPVTGPSTGACPGYVVNHIVPLKRGLPICNGRRRKRRKRKTERRSDTA